MTDVRDDQLEHDIADILEAAEWVFNPRAMVVCGIVFASLMMLNAEIGKSLLFAVGLYFALRLSLARRHIERLTVAFFVVASIYWIDLASVQHWTSLLAKRVSQALA